jgi:hypothetical protein
LPLLLYNHFSFAKSPLAFLVCKTLPHAMSHIGSTLQRSRNGSCFVDSSLSSGGDTRGCCLFHNLSDSAPRSIAVPVNSGFWSTFDREHAPSDLIIMTPKGPQLLTRDRVCLWSQGLI